MTFNRLSSSTLICTQKNTASLHRSAVKQGETAACAIDYRHTSYHCLFPTQPFPPFAPLTSGLLQGSTESALCCLFSLSSLCFSLFPNFISYPLPTNRPGEHFPKDYRFCSNTLGAAHLHREKCHINQSVTLAGHYTRHQAAETMGGIDRRRASHGQAMDDKAEQEESPGSRAMGG